MSIYKDERDDVVGALLGLIQALVGGIVLLTNFAGLKPQFLTSGGVFGVTLVVALGLFQLYLRFGE